MAARVRQDKLMAGGYSPRSLKTRLERIVLHHDAALSADGCRAALDSRKLSTHFCIDNDGTIVQYLDPLIATAWAMNAQNATGISIDFSNACEVRYADRYHPPRGLAKQTIQGSAVTWLALYPCQIDACAELVRVLCRETGIDPVVPLGPDGNAVLHCLSPVPKGVIGHLHCNPQKYDPFGLPWERFAEMIGRPEASP